MGKVFEVTETHVVVEISDNVRIKVVKSTVLRDSADLQQNSFYTFTEFLALDGLPDSVFYFQQP